MWEQSILQNRKAVSIISTFTRADMTARRKIAPSSSAGHCLNATQESLTFFTSLLIMPGTESTSNSSGKQVRFILFDRNGPLSVFDSWEDAYRYMASNQAPGTSIICSPESELTEEESASAT